jgi:transposase
METHRTIFPGAEAAQGSPGKTLDKQSGLCRRYFVGAANGRTLAGSAPEIPERVDLLAKAAGLGRARPLAACLAAVARRHGPATTAGLERGLPRRHLHRGEKRGAEVGKTMRGKGTKCVVVVDGGGIPLGVQLANAKPSEHKFAETTLALIRVPRPGRGRPRSKPRRVVADKGYDSDPLRERLGQRHIDFIVPYRCNSVLRRYQDRRKLRRYRRRWKVERTIAWLQNFRRVQVRYDRIFAVYQGFVHLACLIIVLRHL